MKAGLFVLGLVFSLNAFAETVTIASLPQLDQFLKRYENKHAPILIYDPSKFSSEETSAEVRDALLLFQGTDFWMFPDGTYTDRHLQFPNGHGNNEGFAVPVKVIFLDGRPSVDADSRKAMGLAWFMERWFNLSTQFKIFSARQMSLKPLDPDIKYFEDRIEQLRQVVAHERPLRVLEDLNAVPADIFREIAERKGLCVVELSSSASKRKLDKPPTARME